VAALEKQRTTGLILLLLFALSLGICLAAVGGPILDRTAIGRWLSEYGGTPIEWALYVLGVVLISIVSLAVPMIPYCFFMRWAIRRRLANVTCPHCGYSLLGLSIVNSAVICAECGKQVVLGSHGIRIGDLRRSGGGPGGISKDE
jgi:hypothetical protein